jgi:hypothetical protein
MINKRGKTIKIMRKGGENYTSSMKGKLHHLMGNQLLQVRGRLLAPLSEECKPSSVHLPLIPQWPFLPLHLQQQQQIVLPLVHMTK